MTPNVLHLTLEITPDANRGRTSAGRNKAASPHFNLIAISDLLWPSSGIYPGIRGWPQRGVCQVDPTEIAIGPFLDIGLTVGRIKTPRAIISC